MTSLDMETLQPKSTRDRAKAEVETQAGVEVNGHARLRSDKVKAVLYRCTKDRKRQLEKLADALNTSGRKVSFTETIDAALEALEEKLRGGKR